MIPAIITTLLTLKKLFFIPLNLHHLHITLTKFALPSYRPPLSLNLTPPFYLHLPTINHAHPKIHHINPHHINLFSLPPLPLNLAPTFTYTYPQCISYIPKLITSILVISTTYISTSPHRKLNKSIPLQHLTSSTISPTSLSKPDDQQFLIQSSQTKSTTTIIPITSTNTY